MTTIKLKNGSGAPLAGDLVAGEPALDLTNKRLYTEDSGGIVIEVGTNPTSLTTGGLTVNSTLATINSSGPNVDLVLTESNTNTDARIRNSNGILEIDADLNNEFGSSSIMFAVDGTDKLKIDNNGDISFYNSAGTSQSLFWDASAESLGIGTSSPSSFDAAGDNLVVGTGSGNNGMTVYSGTANAGSLFFADGTGSAAAKADGYIQYTHSNQALAFATGGGSERMRVDSSGNLLVGRTSTSGLGVANFEGGIDVTSGPIYARGSGIYIGGTASANLLDDYEEGSWTPNGNWSSSNAHYVKIGNLVHLSIDATADGTGGTSQITNLPFASEGTVGTGIYTSGVDWASGYTSPTFVVAGTTGYFRVVGDSQAFTSMGITANQVVHLAITYQTA